MPLMPLCDVQLRCEPCCCCAIRGALEAQGAHDLTPAHISSGGLVTCVAGATVAWTTSREMRVRLLHGGGKPGCASASQVQ
jgi:hypothetical protein